MGQTNEDTDEEIELEDKTKNFFVDKKGLFLVQTLKQMDKYSTKNLNETENRYSRKKVDRILQKTQKKVSTKTTMITNKSIVEELLSFLPYNSS